MNIDFIQRILDASCSNYDLIVLKGFSPSLIQNLSTHYNLIDNYVISNGKIILEKVNEQQLMLSILQCSKATQAICTCESFIKMCTLINGLDILGKKICIFENNMLELYPNPSNANIPDFDSDDFQDTEGETPLYSAFYSYCICDDKGQHIQYINNYSQANKCVDERKLIEVEDNFIPTPIVTDTNGITCLSTRDGSLNKILELLYNEMALKENAFVVEAEDLNDEKVRVLVQAGNMLGLQIKISSISRNLSIEPRKELACLMEQVWGYKTYRPLKIYEDLSINRNVIEISQGTIIETVVQQAEHALNEENDEVNNVLLTSPTGAGKSLLFQLAAIYLAQKYDLLTIVISPLVALMNDQVDGLTGYNAVASINSNKTAAEKDAILSGVKDGNINLLYLSPELLLSYSISSFIGGRRIGLFVVDEAHTVTTWGRDFRVDYWFLGDYLRKTKRFLKYPFPIFALTATAVWDPSGKNDMVFDTIRSLYMDPCIKFIGVVKRDNIKFEIELSNISRSYEENRKRLTIRRIREALSLGRKTIVYFPFRRTVDGLFLSDDISDIRSKITRYHASLFPDEKAVNADAFRSGECTIMCATKAFGMGIDVPDISEVYHHAPTGCLSDYVQEIGRLARDPKIQGIAKIDFSPNDFRYIRKLHGLSAIKPYQLMQVLRKLMAIYRINGEKRNMLISASDFSYIFPMSTPDGIDQNLKSCLLLISNDLLNKLRFHALIVRPKSLFSKCFIKVRENEIKGFNKQYLEYIKKVANDIFILDADKLWTKLYNNISFPQFKYKLAEGKIFRGYHVELKNKVTLSLHHTLEDTLRKVEFFFTIAHSFLNKMSETHHRISFKDMKEALPPMFDANMREHFLETFKMLYATNCGLGGEIAAYCSIFTSKEGDSASRNAFQLIQSGYENVYNLYKTAFNSLYPKPETIIYCDPKDTIVKLCEFLNSLGLADYQRQGGDQPAIFVRINNPYYLNMLIRKGKYENDILESIYEKYRYSERIFTYFFTTPMTNEQRWDFIEAYFLGESEEALLNFI